MYTKHPQLHSKTPLSWPDFESEQTELLSGQNGPHLGKMFEKWQNCLKSGQTVGKGAGAPGRPAA